MSENIVSSHGLSWERLAASDEPTSVGICLSGGGLRAAMFGLGVLQVLQERRGLLFGPQSARWLAAVSGGSYTAAAFALNARAVARLDTTKEPPPLAAGSPEERHIVGHGRYLVTPMPHTALTMLGLVLLNALGLVTLFIWAAVMINDLAYIVGEVGFVRRLRPDLPGALWVAGLLVGLYLLVAGLYTGNRIWRLVGPLLGFGVIALTAGPALDALTAESWSHGTTARWVVAMAGLVLLGGSVGLSALLARLGVGGLPAAVANWGQILAVRVTLLALLLLAAVELQPMFRDWFEGSSLVGLGLFFTALAVPLVLGSLMQRHTLHRHYRDRIRSCFDVVRTPDGSAAVTPVHKPALLSQFEGGPYPDLLICATANLRTKDPQGKRRAFAPFVYASDVCGIPGLDGAWLPTAKLELGQLPLPSGKKEPLVTLPVAVATTGAAVSPSMGRHTQASARPIIAALNIRLGRWLPNVLHPERRSFVLGVTEPRSFATDTRLSAAYDELVPEMLGITNTDMYVSDGGHYDNLGLMALLRAKCAEIWCVDSSPDPAGTASELTRVLALAAYELGTSHDLDVEAFRTSTPSYYPTLFTSGTITYAGGTTAVLHVVKLGLDSEAPSPLTTYAAKNRPFPHHPTTRQWFTQPRSEAYVALGRYAASNCLNCLDGPSPSGR